MPLLQRTKPQSEKQIAAQKLRRQARSGEVHTDADVNSKAPNYKSSQESKLRDFFNDYDQRYYRINERYPIGCFERQETMRVHQEEAIRKIKGIMG